MTIPWLVRAIPVVGATVAAAMVVYTVIEHFQKQQVQVQENDNEEAISLQTYNEDGVPLFAKSATNNEINGDENRSQLCVWLGLPLDALDEVPSSRLASCLDALSYIPVPARVAFIAVFCDYLVTDELVDHFLILLQSMNNEINDNDEDDDSAKEQFVVLVKQTAMHAPVSVFLQALELCPLEHRPVFLSRLYSLWNFNYLNTLMLHLGRWVDDHSRTYQLVEALIQLKAMDHCLAENLMELLTRLDDPQGLLRALRLAGHDNHDDNDTTTRRLLRKLVTVPDDRLALANRCFLKFTDHQVMELIRTLTTESTPMGMSVHSTQNSVSSSLN